MTANIRLENADNAILNALKSVLKLNPQVKFKIKREKEPSDELLEAIAELKDMKKNPTPLQKLRKRQRYDKSVFG